jgi:hypothetical protein
MPTLLLTAGIQNKLHYSKRDPQVRKPMGLFVSDFSFMTEWMAGANSDYQSNQVSAKLGTRPITRYSNTPLKYCTGIREIK